MKSEDIPAYHKNTQYEKKSMFTIFIIDLKPIDTKISADYFTNNIIMATENSELMKKFKIENTSFVCIMIMRRVILLKK